MRNETNESDMVEPETPLMTLEQEVAAVLNRFSQENASNTPDFILAQYLLACLGAFNTATQQRETWYGRDRRPIAGGELLQPSESGS